MPKLKEIIDVLEAFAPLHLAESWDNVGLMIGSRAREVSKVLCALDLNEEVIEEAIHLGAECIITHHPFLFKPLKQIDLDTREGKMIARLIEAQIAVYAMHTNYDIAKGGLNDYLAEGLGLTHIKSLVTTHEEPFYKCIVYVPVTHYEAVREVIVKDNTANIGSYKGCTFTTSGTGSFIPLEGATPYLGEVDHLELVEECQLSFMVEQSRLKLLMDQVKAVHPYEEVAFDVYELKNMKKQEGIGRIGELEAPISFETFVEQVKAYFKIPYVRLTPTLCKEVSTVAICSGSGAEYIKQASQKADVYITGDLKFHEAQLAKALGLTVIDVGHYASENRALIPIVNCIISHFEACEVVLSQVNGEMLLIQ